MPMGAWGLARQARGTFVCLSQQAAQDLQPLSTPRAEPAGGWGCDRTESKQGYKDALGLNPVDPGTSRSATACRSVAPCIRRGGWKQDGVQGRRRARAPQPLPGDRAMKFFCQEKPHQTPST